MTYFKKFTDFCSGFAAFTALIYLFRRFMTFKFEDAELGIIDKMKLFLSRTAQPEYYMMFMLAITLIISVIGGRVFARLPFIAAVFCVPPLLMSVDMVYSELIKEYPMLYIILCAAAVVGAVVDCMCADRTDGKHRCSHTGNAVTLMFSVFCLYVARKSMELSSLVDEADLLSLTRLESEIYRASGEFEMRFFYVLAATYAVLALIGFILYDIYFVNACLSLAPAGYLIYQWGAGGLTVHAEILVTFAVTVCAIRLIPAISCKAQYKSRANA